MQRFLDNNKPGKKTGNLNLWRNHQIYFALKDTITACYRVRNIFSIQFQASFKIYSRTLSLNDIFIGYENWIMRLHRCWWQMDVGDFKLVTIFGCWWQNFDIGDIFWVLVPDANA